MFNKQNGNKQFPKTIPFRGRVKKQLNMSGSVHAHSQDKKNNAAAKRFQI